MSEKIVQLNEEIIKGQLKELVRGSVGVRRTENSGILAKGGHLRALNRGRTADL